VHMQKRQERYKKHIHEEGHKVTGITWKDQKGKRRRESIGMKTYCGEIMDLVRNGHNWKEGKESLSVQRMGKSLAQLGQPLR
jgi:hypothetical protein